MDSPDKLLETEDVRLLVEIGFIALSAGLDGDAETIFAGVQAARPREEAGPLGLAMVHMARNQLDQAVATLRALPPSDAALTYLGLALARRGDAAEARNVLAGVVETAPDTPFAALAEAGIREMAG